MQDRKRPRRETPAQHAGGENEAAERGDGEDDECVDLSMVGILVGVDQVRDQACGESRQHALVMRSQRDAEEREGIGHRRARAGRATRRATCAARDAGASSPFRASAPRHVAVSSTLHSSISRITNTRRNASGNSSTARSSMRRISLRAAPAAGSSLPNLTMWGMRSRDLLPAAGLRWCRSRRWACAHASGHWLR